MKLFHVWREDSAGWDEYSDFVCAAETPEQACMMHPGGTEYIFDSKKNDWYNCGGWSDSQWVNPERVKFEYLGEADKPDGPMIICASYHAG